MRPWAALALVFACSSPPQAVPEVPVDDTLKQDLRTIAAARVFFGHHSVGQDLLDGLKQLSAQAGVPVTLQDVAIGANQQPLGKMDDFARQLQQRTAPPDVAAMKLCYVDFTPDTDTAALLKHYQDTVARIRAAQPTVRLLHITAPLHVHPTDLKSTLNRALGRRIWEDAANARRLAYNEALKQAFAQDAIFDLADVEATRPDATREAHAVDGREVPMLWPGWSRDGGHLNGAGQRHGARAFAHALAKALTGAPHGG